MEFEYDKPPRIGTVHDRYGQQYELVSARPYTRRDGAQSYVLTWRSKCADCDQPFEATTGLKVRSMNRRCDAHKAARIPATEGAAEAWAAGQLQGQRTRQARRRDAAMGVPRRGRTRKAPPQEGVHSLRINNAGGLSGRYGDASFQWSEAGGVSLLAENQEIRSALEAIAHQLREAHAALLLVS